MCRSAVHRSPNTLINLHKTCRRVPRCDQLPAFVSSVFVLQHPKPNYVAQGCESASLARLTHQPARLFASFFYHPLPSADISYNIACKAKLTALFSCNSKRKIPHQTESPRWMNATIARHSLLGVNLNHSYAYAAQFPHMCWSGSAFLLLTTYVLLSNPIVRISHSVFVAILPSRNEHVLY